MKQQISITIQPMNDILNRRSKLLLALTVSLLTVVIYLPVFRNEFILWDDDLYITKNCYIHHFDWSMVKWAFLNPFHGLWQPLTSISLAVDCAIWGLNPYGFHLSNVVLHAFSTFVVVIICVSLMERMPEVTVDANSTSSSGNSGILIAAGVTGLLFGIHPLHVESVAWASERKDVLYGFFYLLSGYFYVAYVARQNNVYDNARWFLSKTYLCSLLFFVLSLLSKSMAVTLPVVLLVLEWYPLKRIVSLKTLSRSTIEKIPFFVFAIISSIITLIVISPEQGTEQLPLHLRPLIAARATVAYLQKTIFPFDLLPYYPYPPNNEITLLSPVYLLPVIITVVISGYAFLSVIVCTSRHSEALGKFCRSATRGKGWQSAWLCYIVMLFPVIGIFDNGGTHSMAHRYFYLPSLGPFCLLGIVSARIWEKSRDQLILRKVSLAAAAFVSVSLLWITFQQIQIWKDSIAFWSYVIAKTPSPVPMAYNNRGLAYKQKGEFEKAIADLNRLLELYPDSHVALINRGGVLIDAGDFDRAITDSSRAIALDPSDSSGYLNLGLALKMKGEPGRAMENLNRAIELDPSKGSAYNARGLIWKSAGEYDKALQDYSRAVELMPDNADARINRGVVLELVGRPDDAIRDYDRAIALNPKHFSAFNNRGLALRKKGQLRQALEDFDQAVSLNALLYLPRLNRAMTLEALGEFERAFEDYTAVLALKTDLAVAYLGRGAVQGKLNRLELALSDYEKACRLGNQEGCAELKRRRP